MSLSSSHPIYTTQEGGVADFNKKLSYCELVLSIGS